jgi:hypothetical protein
VTGGGFRFQVSSFKFQVLEFSKQFLMPPGAPEPMKRLTAGLVFNLKLET